MGQMAESREKSILIIFVKNPVCGKVKTRLGKTIGDDLAVKVYELLLQRTLSVVQDLPCEIQVHYADQPIENDLWQVAGFSRYSQQGNSLGERMDHAIRSAFTEGAQKVLIIGSDCYQLTQSHIEEAISSLGLNQAVLGPSTDGGYYLLGMRTYSPFLFENKAWSTDRVLEETLLELDIRGMPYHKLSPLTDVDTEKDLITIPAEVLRRNGILQIPDN